MGKDPIHLFLCPKFSQRIHKNVLQQKHKRTRSNIIAGAVMLGLIYFAISYYPLCFKVPPAQKMAGCIALQF